MGNVILIGFMGCGKSSVAVKLSYRMKQPMTDTDKWIERKQGKTISEIFVQDGEDAFRSMETEALKALKETAKNQVISVGGGLPVREENRALLKEIGKVVYLRAKPETLYERVKEDVGRPLLQCENPMERIGKLLEERKDVYESAADLIVDVDGKNFGQVLFEIERWLRPSGRINPPSNPPVRGWREAADSRHFTGQQCLDRPETGQKGKTDSGPVLTQPLKKLLVINGPNLNFLGIREKGVYGTKTYKDLQDMIARKGMYSRVAVDVWQSNHEGAIIDRIQAAYFDGTDGIIINPGAYTHYSYAIRDALASITVPKVEVHISNIMEREEFRHVSVTAPVCDKQIYGHGLEGYLEAMDYILKKEKTEIG